MSSLVPLFSLSVSGEGSSVMKSLPEFDCQNTLAGLADSSISLFSDRRPGARELLLAFHQRGFVDPPPLAVGTS